MFDPELAAGLDAQLELRLGDERFRATLGDGDMELARGDAAAPDAVVTTDPGTLLAIAYGWRELQAAIDADEIAIDGDRELVEWFLGLFALPAPYAPAA